MNKEKTLEYFDELTNRLNLSQGIPKVVSEVQDNDEVIPEYHLQRYITPVTDNDVILDAWNILRFIKVMQASYSIYIKNPSIQIRYVLDGWTIKRSTRIAIYLAIFSLGP